MIDYATKGRHTGFHHHYHHHDQHHHHHHQHHLERAGNLLRTFMSRNLSEKGSAWKFMGQSFFLVYDKKSLFLSNLLFILVMVGCIWWTGWKWQSEWSGESHLKLEDWRLVAGKVQLLHVGAGAKCCEFLYILYASFWVSWFKRFLVTYIGGGYWQY